MPSSRCASRRMRQPRSIYSVGLNLETQVAAGYPAAALVYNEIGRPLMILEGLRRNIGVALGAIITAAVTPVIGTVALKLAEQWGWTRDPNAGLTVGLSWLSWLFQQWWYLTALVALVILIAFWAGWTLRAKQPEEKDPRDLAVLSRKLATADVALERADQLISRGLDTADTLPSVSGELRSIAATFEKLKIDSPNPDLGVALHARSAIAHWRVFIASIRPLLRDGHVADAKQIAKANSKPTSAGASPRGQA